MIRRPTAETLAETEGAFLTRSDLRDLGLDRRAVDAVFGTLPSSPPRLLPADGPRRRLPPAGRTLDL